MIERERERERERDREKQTNRNSEIQRQSSKESTNVPEYYNGVCSMVPTILTQHSPILHFFFAKDIIFTQLNYI